MKNILTLALVLGFSFNSFSSVISQQCYRQDGADSPLMDRAMAFGSVDFRLTADSEVEVEEHMEWSKSFISGQLTDFEGVSVGNLTTEKFISSDTNGTVIKVLFRTSNPDNKELADWFSNNMYNEYEPSEVDVEITFVCQEQD